MVLEAYNELVSDDAEGFMDVRRRMDAWFPKLEHVATSAQGASIGPHIAAFTVTPQQMVTFASALRPPSQTNVHYSPPPSRLFLFTDPRLPLVAGHEAQLAGGACHRVASYG